MDIFFGRKTVLSVPFPSFAALVQFGIFSAVSLLRFGVPALNSSQKHPESTQTF